MRVLTDEDIQALRAEQKVLPANWSSRLALREKSGQMHRQREVEVSGAGGSTFRIVVRQSVLNPLDFSIILTFVDTDRGEYRLVRFNGRHPSDHTNKWEKRNRMPDCKFRNQFHVHQATERYQIDGLEIDGYAEVTRRYDSFESALAAFVTDNGIQASDGVAETPLFDDPTGNRK